MKERSGGWAAAEEHGGVETLAGEEGRQVLGWERIKGAAVLSVCFFFNWTLDRTSGDKYKSHRQKLEGHGMEEATEGQSLGGDEEVGR